MLHNFRNWLTSKHLANDKNIFETAKIKLVADFSIYLFIFGFGAILLSILTKDYTGTFIVSTCVSTNLLAFSYIKITGKYELAAKIISLNIIFGLITISFVNHAIIDMMYLAHALIAILFAHFVLNRNWSLFIGLIFCNYILFLTFSRDTYLFSTLDTFFNPNFKIEYLKKVSPFITLFNCYIIIKLLDFHKKNQSEALKITSNLNKLKEGILGIVAHDLRGPIANIVVVNEFLKTNFIEKKHDDSENLAYTVMIDDMCKRSLSIINDLVDIAEIESEDFSLELESLFLNDLINKIVEPLKISASQKNILLTYIPLNTDVIVNMNRDKFSRVIENIISNSIKFTNKGGEIKFSLSNSSTHVLIKLEDNGIGIPEKLKPFVFDKFTNAGRRGTAGEKSMGIGMSITKKIIELHKGKIWFESKEKVGTSFYIELKSL